MLLLLTVVSRGMVTDMQQPQAAETPAPDQTSSDEIPLLVTARVAGKMLGLSTWHLGSLIDSGDLPSTRIGSTLFVPSASITEFARQVASGERSITPTAAAQ